MFSDKSLGYYERPRKLRLKLWRHGDFGVILLKCLKFLRDLRMLATIRTLLCHSHDSVAIHINCTNSTLDSIIQGCARGLFSRDRAKAETLETDAETEALTIHAEARPRPRPSELETEMRPRRTNSEARPSRGTTAPRDGLETEASRPRPHPHHSKD